MKATELKSHLSNYLKKNGTDAFARLISDSVDSAGALNNGIQITAV